MKSIPISWKSPLNRIKLYISAQKHEHRTCSFLILNISQSQNKGMPILFDRHIKDNIVLLQYTYSLSLMLSQALLFYCFIYFIILFIHILNQLLIYISVIVILLCAFVIYISFGAFFYSALKYIYFRFSFSKFFNFQY